LAINLLRIVTVYQNFNMQHSQSLCIIVSNFERVTQIKSKRLCVRK